MNENLKTIIDRKKKTLTQEEIAKRLGISQQYVSKILRGKSNNPKLTKRISTLLKKEGII